jgi:ADP-heptose:LPS heptosyltransferase
MQRSVPQKILLIRAGALGDCLLMLPTLHALRAHFPRARLDVMGYPPRWEWALGRGLVDAVHSTERPGMHLMFGEGLEIPEELRAFLGTYDVILSYRPDPDGVFQRNLEALGGPLVLSQSPFPPPPPPKVHVADFALQLVAQLGVSAAPTTSGLSLGEAELALSRPFFTSHGVDPARQPLAVVHPGSGSPAKRWPVEKFVSLIETLEDQLGMRTVIVTGYADTDVVGRLRPLVRAATPLVAENWPLLQTASVIAHASVFVGHDSGLTHLAAALRRPTVALFGPTDPDIWKPRGEHVTVVSMMRADAGDHEHDPARGISHASHIDLRQVLEAVRYWLAVETARQSPGARSVPL